MGLKDEQVIIVSNIGEDNSCYDAAVDLAKNKGCKIIFADSFGHESFMKKAAQEYPDVQFCHAAPRLSWPASTISTMLLLPFMRAVIWPALRQV